MRLNDYARWTDQVWKGNPFDKTTERDMAITALGFTGEAGEVVEFFKKHLRDGKEIHRNEELALELGDAIFYWARLCMYVGFTPEEVLQMNKDKLNARYAELRKQRGVA